MTKMDPRKVEFVLRAMGLTSDTLRKIQQLPTQAEADIQLAAFKKAFKAGFRRLAQKWHPDHSQNDPTKTEWFQHLTDLKIQIDKLQVQIQAPQRAARGVVIHYYPTTQPAKTAKVDVQKPEDTTHTKFTWVKIR